MNDHSINKYLLDTNTVSYFIKGHDKVCEHIYSIPMSDLAISAITEGELLYGLAKKPEAKQLHKLVHEFLIHLDILPWNSMAAACYGELRAKLQSTGKTLGNLDQLIAAHALASNLILVSSDKAFTNVTGLKIVDWANM